MKEKLATAMFMGQIQAAYDLYKSEDITEEVFRELIDLGEEHMRSLLQGKELQAPYGPVSLSLDNTVGKAANDIVVSYLSE